MSSKINIFTDVCKEDAVLFDEWLDAEIGRSTIYIEADDGKTYRIVDTLTTDNNNRLYVVYVVYNPDTDFTMKLLADENIKWETAYYYE